MPRILLWLLAIPLLLIIAAAVLVPLILDEEKLIALASDTLEAETGVTLEVKGESSLTFFPVLGVRLADARLSLPEGNASTVRVRALEIGAQFMPLLSRRIEIGRISVDGLVAKLQPAAETPEIDTSGYSDEELDAFYAARRQAIADAGTSAGPEAALLVPLALNVEQLSVTDTRIEQFAAEPGESTVIEIIDLRASGLNLEDKPIPLEGRVRIPGKGDAQALLLSMDGKIRVNQATQELSLDELTIELQGATPDPLRLKTRGEVILASQLANLQLDLELGATRGAGTLRYAGFESPQIDADLHLNLFDPALLVLAGPEAAEKQAESGPSGSGDDPLPLDAIRSIDTRASLRIDRAVFDAHAITDLNVQLRAVEGVVELRSLTGELHGGKLAMEATFDASHNTASLETEGSLEAMDIATALAAMESDPVLTGIANVNWTLDGKGKTSDELIRGLQGPINIKGKQAVLQDIGVERMLCQVVALVNREQLSNTLPTSSRFDKLAVNIKLKDGKARLSPLTIELPQVKLTGKGRLHLIEQDFSARFAAELSPELAELDPACRVNERLTDIDWPVNCEGQISGDPGDWCTVDAEEILGDIATNEAERKLKDEAGKLFDKLLKR